MCRGVTPLTQGSVLSEGSAGLHRPGLGSPHSGLTTQQGPMGEVSGTLRKPGHALQGLHGASAGARGTGEGQAEPPHGFKLGQKRGMSVTTIHNLSESLFGTQMFRLQQILFIDTQPKSTAASQQTENQPKTFRRQEPPHPPPQSPAPHPPCTLHRGAGHVQGRGQGPPPSRATG